MVRGVGHALVDLPGDLLDGALALRQHIDDLGSPAAGERLGDRGEGVEQGILGHPLTHDLPRSLFPFALPQIFTRKFEPRVPPVNGIARSGARNRQRDVRNLLFRRAGESILEGPQLKRSQT